MNPNTEQRNLITSGTQPFTPQAPYRFNAEELRVLRQCNRESFYQRSLPIASVFSIGTFYAVKTGYLRTHPRFGATPKVVIAATVGYFIGKFSYQSKCADKLMQLPNSPLGEMLRQRKRKGVHQELFSDQTSLSWPDSESVSNPSLVSELERPMGDGLDSYRPLDSTTFEDDPILSTPSQSTSYEELRRKNREEYEQKRTKPFRTSASSPDDLPLPSISTPLQRDTASQKAARNKYGDVWAE